MQARPNSLSDVATRSDSLERFGRELADWLHTLRTLGSRPALRRHHRRRDAGRLRRPALRAHRRPTGAILPGGYFDGERY